MLPRAPPEGSAFGPLQADEVSFCDKAGLQALPILTQIWEAAQVHTALHFRRPPPPPEPVLPKPTHVPWSGRPASPQLLPPLIVVQVREEHVLGDGLGQRRHGLVVLGDDLRGGQAKSDLRHPRA